MLRYSAALVTVALLSFPAFACGRHGIELGVGPVYLSIGHEVPCYEVAQVVVAPLPAPPLVVVPVVPQVYLAPPMVAVESEVIEVAPPPPPVAQVYVAPLPVPPPPQAPVAAPVIVVAQPAVVVAPPEEVQRLAVKWTPGFSAPVNFKRGINVSEPALGQSFGLEYRLNKIFALRGDFEMRDNARSFDIPGLKISLPLWRLRPFVSGGLSLGQATNIPGTDIGFVVSAGLDIQLFKHFFITGEARYQQFPGDCCSLPRVSGLVGIGASFF